MNQLKPRRIGRRVPWMAMVASVATLAGALPARSLDRSTTDPRKVINAVQSRDEGNRETAKMTMTVTDPSGRQRVRKLQSRRMKFSGGTKLLLLFEWPADVRNTGLLVIDYTDPKKDDDQWLYLPSLHHTTRIAASNRSASFLGSDISYADMTRADASQYDYKMLDDSVSVNGEDCWHIEARPRTPQAMEQTGYLKTELWISKSKLVPVQSKMWVREGKKLKFAKYQDIKKIDGIWTTQKITVQTVRDGKVLSTTVLQLSNVRYNDPSVTDADFTQARLQKGL